MNNPRVFVSYSHSDAQWLGDLVESLHDLGIDVETDISSIPAGEKFADALEHSLRNCDAIVILLSEYNVKSPTVFFDIGAALGMRKPLISIVPKDLDVATIPVELRKRRNLSKGTPQDAAREIADAIRAKAA
jgi:hypothetical protein